MKRPSRWPWILLSLLAIIPAGPHANPAPVRKLPPSSWMEQSLTTGSVHRYEFELSAATHEHLIVVQQQGIDVTIVVTGPDSRRISAVDNPLDRQGRERLLLELTDSISPTSIQIEIHARENGAPTGRYSLIVKSLAQVDRRLLDAERALTRAGELYFEATDESYRQALTQHGLALLHWRATGNRREQARALYCMSVLARLTDQTRKAQDLALQALPLWKALDESYWQAATLNELGLDSRLLGQTTEAQNFFDRSLAIYQSLGDSYGEATALANVCLMKLTQGELRPGITCYEQAIPLLKKIQAPALENAAQHSIGYAYDLIGEPARALDHYQAGLTLMRSSGDRGGEARTLNNLAVLQRSLGQTQASLANHGLALEIFTKLKQTRWQARVLGNIGLIYLDLGESERSLDMLHQALNLWRQVDDPKGQAAALTAVATVYTRLERYDEALPLHRQALNLRQITQDRRGIGGTLSLLGHAQAQAGQNAAATESFHKAITILQEVDDHGNEAIAQRLQGQLLLKLGQIEPALASFQQALELTREGDRNPAHEARTLVGLAQTQRQAGQTAAARRSVMEALDRFESVRGQIVNADLRASASASQAGAFELAIDLLMEDHLAAPTAGHHLAALELNERSRARSLLELLAEAQIVLNTDGADGLIEQQRSLHLRLQAKTERLLNTRDERQRQELAIEHTEILRQLDLVEAEIRRQSAASAEVNWPNPLGTGQIRDLLDAETMLLSYNLGETRSFLWAVTRQQVRAFELPKRAVIEELARRVHQHLGGQSSNDGGLSRGPIVEESERQLSDILLGPVAGDLDSHRLVIVADGALHYLPFAALPLPNLAPARPADQRLGRVLDRHEVVHLPSASILASTRLWLSNRTAAARRMIVVADPVFDASDSRVKSTTSTAHPVFERLPASRREADLIAALAAPNEVQVLLGFDAARQHVVGNALAPYRIVHFATHGVVDARRPTLSGLVLSRVNASGGAEDGFLSLHDLYNLKLQAELVVLSGCRTALGREVRGEGMVGLTRAFFHAGAPRVIASLWRVDDRATAALMDHFYRALWHQGLRPAAALKAAQQALRQEQRWRHPAYWAAFVLMGEWR